MSAPPAAERVTRPREITPRRLAAMPLPHPSSGGGKEERGRVLVIAGSPGTPGAALLAATGALRAGAGKLQIATGRSLAGPLAQAMPEAMVVALPETRAGGIAAAGLSQAADLAHPVHGVLIGPGMCDTAATARLVRAVLERSGRDTVVVLDAEAMTELRAIGPVVRALRGRVVITPHAGEMAGLLGVSKTVVERDPGSIASRVARELGVVVVLKGSETHIVAPDGTAYVNRAGCVGLGTSGSGDVLAGILVGLAARGASALEAAVWSVHLHARAGDRLSRRIGPLGFLARELLAEVPALMHAFDRRGRARPAHS